MIEQWLLRLDEANTDYAEETIDLFQRDRAIRQVWSEAHRLGMARDLTLAIREDMTRATMRALEENEGLPNNEKTL